MFPTGTPLSEVLAARPSSSSNTRAEKECPGLTASSSTSEWTATLSKGKSSEDATSSETSSPDRLVRFEEQCILIPDSTLLSPPKSSGPRIITKSLSLPLWKWTSFGNTLPSSVSTQVSSENAPGILNAGGKTLSVQEGQSPLHQGNLIVKVPIPVFRKRTSLSPVRARQFSVCPLPPCLIHKSDSVPVEGTDRTSSRSRSRQKRSSTPTLTLSHATPSHTSNSLCPLLETVPLRSCCEACLSGCDIPSAHWHIPHSAPSLKAGQSDPTSPQEEDWCAGMNFTKGALRRRRSSSASVERADSRHRRRSASFSGEGSGSGSFSGTLVRVDEVDKLHDSNVKVTLTEAAPRSAPSSSSLMCSLSGLPRPRTPSPTSLSSAAVLAAERDRDELFPLPSPTRSPRLTPSGSPKISPSPSASQANLVTGPSPQVLESAIKAKLRNDAESKCMSEYLKANNISPPIPVPARATVGHAKVYPRPVRPAFRATPARSVLDDLEPYYNNDSNQNGAVNTINIDSPPPSPPPMSQSPPKKTARRRPSIQGAIAGALRGFSLSSTSSGSGSGVGVMV